LQNASTVWPGFRVVESAQGRLGKFVALILIYSQVSQRVGAINLPKRLADHSWSHGYPLPIKSVVVWYEMYPSGEMIMPLPSSMPNPQA